MNQKTKEQLIRGSMTEGPGDMIHGLYRGYYVVLALTQTGFEVTINAVKKEGEPLETPSAFLSHLQLENDKITTASASDYALKFTVRAAGLAKNLPEQINPLIDRVIDYLVREQFVTGCGHCGSAEGEIGLYNINDDHQFLCQACGKEVGAELENNRLNYLSKKSNLVTGLIGALIGMLLGGVLWVVIYHMGYIAGIGGAAIAVGALKGYELLGRHLDTKGVLISVVVAIAGIYIANTVAWTFEIYNEFNKEFPITFTEAYRSISSFMKDSTFREAYIKDLVMGYVLSVVCSAPIILQAYRTSRGKYKIKKVN